MIHSKAKKHPIETLSAEVEAMQEHLEMTKALMGGTTAMRLAGEKFLPRWPAEDMKAHAQRLRLATLRPAYKRTVTTMVGKPMGKPIGLSDPFPEPTKKLLDDIDGTGRNLDAFVSDVLESAIAHGQCHIFVDAPKKERDVSVAEAKAIGLRPYFVKVDVSQLIAFKAPNGKLTHVRYFETASEPGDDEYSEKSVRQIRVLDRGKNGVTWQVWREVDKPTEDGSMWEMHDSGLLSAKGIPWSTVFGRRVGVMSSVPPMLEMAHLNVKHWQSQSDQDNIVHVVRVPILTVIGAEPDFTLVVGAQSAVKLPVAASLGYVEHSGAAVGIGKTSLDDLVEEMRQSGAEMLVARGVAATATEVATDSAASMSDLQRIVRGAQDALNQALVYLGEYLGISEEAAGEVSLFNEFTAHIGAEATSTVLLSANTAGVLSKETTFKEFQRRGVISDALDFEEERERIDGEGPEEPPQGKIDPLTGLPYKEPVPPTPKE